MKSEYTYFHFVHAVCKNILLPTWATWATNLAEFQK